MTWPIFVSFITAITGLIGALWAIVKYYDKKRTRREELRHEEEKAKAAAESAQRKQWIESLIQPLHDTNERQCRAIESLEANYHTLKDQVNNLGSLLGEAQAQLAAEHERIDANEQNRLQTAIMDFAMQLRNGAVVDLNGFNYICHAYDRYKILHGNSFIDSEMEYITKKKEEWDLTHPDGEEE